MIMYFLQIFHFMQFSLKKHRIIYLALISGFDSILNFLSYFPSFFFNTATWIFFHLCNNLIWINFHLKLI